MTVNLALCAPPQIVAAIKSRADRSSASVVIAMAERNGVGSYKTAVHSLPSQHVIRLTIDYPLDEKDAIIVATVCGTVLVLFLDASNLTPINGVTFSRGDGACLDVEHLVQHGHQRIVLLGGPHTSTSVRFWHVGWHKYLAHYQLQLVAGLEDDWNAMSGFQQTMHMLNNGNFPTTMLVANDQMALDAMRATNEFGLRVAVDISMIGYDNTEDSACYIPPPTTIRQGFPLLGEASVDRLLQLPRGESTVGNQLLPVALVEYKTVPPPDAQTTTPQTSVGSPIRPVWQVSQLVPKL